MWPGTELGSRQSTSCGKKYARTGRAWLLRGARPAERLSGGGLLNIGVGWNINYRHPSFLGISGGFYDRPGLLYQTRFRLDRTWDMQVAARIGQAGDRFEGAISGGLVYHFGR